MTQDVVREVALEVYSEEKVDEFIDYHPAKFQATLVEEFNQRLADKRPLRFQIADQAGIGKIVAGNTRIRSQEKFAFRILSIGYQRLILKLAGDSPESSGMPRSILDAFIT